MVYRALLPFREEAGVFVVMQGHIQIGVLHLGVSLWGGFAWVLLYSIATARGRPYQGVGYAVNKKLGEVRQDRKSIACYFHERRGFGQKK